MGLRIFLHSVRLVFNQLGGALRISGLLYILSLVVLGGAMFYFAQTMVLEPQPTFPWHMLLIGPAVGLVYLWIAVGWHRFVLLDELPASPLPAFHGDRLLAYFGRLVQAGLIGFAAALVLGFALSLVVMVGQGSPFVAIPGAIAVMTILLLISYRLAPIFPAAAIGRPIGVSQAWAATSGASGTIIVLAIVSAIASVLIDLPAQLLVFTPIGGRIILTLIWLAIVTWIKLMVGVSILTTLYGVYVEKRAIAD